MIKSIKLIDSEKLNKTDYAYINEDKNKHLKSLLEKGIEFSNGVNILIGENGSGKSTILNIIKDITFCNDKWQTEFDTSKFDHFKLEDVSELAECFEIKADYNYPYFNLFQLDANNIKEFEITNPHDFQQLSDRKHKSDGQNVKGNINQLWYYLFSSELNNSPIKIINEIKCNDFYESFKIKVLNFYNSNNFELENKIITIFMDEPECGLDIEGIKSIYEILSFERDDTQLIVNIHNIALINKLECNMIEISENYKNEVKKFCL